VITRFWLCPRAERRGFESSALQTILISVQARQTAGLLRVPNRAPSTVWAAVPPSRPGANTEASLVRSAYRLVANLVL